MDDPNAYYSHDLAVAMYDAFTGGGLLTGDVEFHLDCAARFGGPILELGTGTGRILIPLAEAGHDIVGLDLSAAMLGIAACKLDRRPDLIGRTHLVQGDMSNFALERLFALVIVPARSFQHLLTPASQRTTLRNVHRHLIPGGHLILDLFDPNFEVCLRRI